MSGGIRGEGEAEGHARAAGPGVGPWGDRSFRFLLVVLVVATPALLHAGRVQWFALDEWDFLVRRDLARPGTLFEAWFGHNVALPAVAYRGLFEVWGLSTYRPYQLLGIAGHYAVVVAVWALSRRLGVRGWIAVVVVAPLIFLGVGRVNILFGFQVTMTAALALSLAHLLLADHDGPWSKRDVAGILCGGAALLCSGVAVAGLAGVGAATLTRRGPRVAAAHTVPLGVAWLAWRQVAPRRGLQARTALDAETLRFLVAMPKAALGGLARYEVFAYALGALAVVGVVAAIRWQRRAPRDRSWFGPLAPLVGCVAMLGAFALLTASQRLARADLRAPTEGRYVYVVVALSVPLLALGVEAVARYRRNLVVVPLALLAVGVPANLRALDDRIHIADPRDRLLALANSELLADAPPGPVTPLHTAEELRQIATFPGLPGADGVERAVQLDADLMLGLRQGPRFEDLACRLLRGDHRHVEAGDVIDFEGSITVTALDGTDHSTPRRYDEEAGGRLTASGPLTVEIERVPYTGPGSNVYVCARSGTR